MNRLNEEISHIAACLDTVLRVLQLKEYSHISIATRRHML